MFACEKKEDYFFYCPSPGDEDIPGNCPFPEQCKVNVWAINVEDENDTEYH